MRRQIGHLTSELEYFHELDAELIGHMRRRAALEEQRRCMAEASQINDPKLLEALEKLGYNPKTVSLLCLAPLVQVAWADGSIHHAERDQVLAIAKLHGLKEDTPGYQQVLAWLDQSPAEDFFEGTLSVIQAVLESLPQDEQQARHSALMQDCMHMASVAGHLGRIGSAERKVLDKIRKRLEPQQRAAASPGT